MSNGNDGVIEVNVGGHIYCTSVGTLIAKRPKSKLALSFIAFLSKKPSSHLDLIPILLDSHQRPFIDRDGESFRHILDYLRLANEPDVDWLIKLIPNISDRFRLKLDAEFYGIAELIEKLSNLQGNETANKHVVLKNNTQQIREAKTCMKNTTRANNTGIDRQVSVGPLANGGPYFISIGYRGAYTATRDGPTSDIAKFRKITRITVSGRSDVAKEVFMDELNESRDPDRYPADAYTSRYYLKHNYLECAFETLARRGFELVSSCSSGSKTLPSSAKDEFKQWTTYLEYVFYRRPNGEQQ